MASTGIATASAVRVDHPHEHSWVQGRALGDHRSSALSFLLHSHESNSDSNPTTDRYASPNHDGKRTNRSLP